MIASEELVWLIGRLRDARSKPARLRLLLGAWETLRRLSPAERLAVARQLGFDGAERLVEEVALRRGFDAAPLVEALDGIEQSAGDEVDDVIRGLVDPARRAETVDRLLERAGRWAGGLEAPSHQEPAAGGEAAAARPLEDEGVASDARPVELEPTAAAAPPTILPAAAPTEATGAVPVVGQQVVAGGGRAAAVNAPPLTDKAALRLVAELTAEPRVLARLRRLAGAAGSLAGAGRSGLVAVLECFPAGWPRRRALERLLEAGVPTSLTDAIALLGMLQRPSERLWAATTLAATRSLDDGERTTLLGTVTSPAQRRRLERRLGGGGE